MGEVITYSRDFLAEEALVLGRFSTRDDPLPEPDNLSLVLNNTYDAENVRQRVRDREGAIPAPRARRRRAARLRERVRAARRVRRGREPDRAARARAAPWARGT